MPLHTIDYRFVTFKGSRLAAAIVPSHLTGGYTDRLFHLFVLAIVYNTSVMVTLSMATPKAVSDINNLAVWRVTYAFQPEC